MTSFKKNSHIKPMTTATTIANKPAVIFDLFHTLTSLEAIAGTHTCELLGVDRNAWNEQLLKHSPERLLGHITDPLEIIRRLARNINPDIAEDTIRTATESRVARFARSLIDIPQESIDVLRALKETGKKIGLVSNADYGEIAAWEKSPIASLFDSVLFSCYAGCKKPEPEIYLRSLEELSVTSDQAAFVGDGGSNELEGARKVGLTPVLFTGVINRMHPEKITARIPQADHVIDRLSQLLG